MDIPLPWLIFVTIVTIIGALAALFWPKRKE